MTAFSGALRLAAAVALILGALGFAVFEAGAAPKHRPAALERWVTYQNARFGYSLYYPSALFDAEPESVNGDGRVFLSRDGRAKIVVYGAHNADGMSPKEYRQMILTEFPDYREMDYNPIGKTWFVLSGYRGENVYYQKVIFSCNLEIVNAISVTYPVSEKLFYDGLVETLEDHFKPGRGADTPPRC